MRFVPPVAAFVAGILLVLSAFGEPTKDAVGNQNLSGKKTRRVAIFGPPDATALVETALSRVQGVEVLERANFSALQAEQILSAASLRPLAMRLGSTADVFFLLEQEPDSTAWTLILADALDGRELNRAIRLPFGKLQEESLRLLVGISPVLDVEGTKVVILESNDPEARAVGQLIREFLGRYSVPILDRSLAWQVLDERFSVQGGFQKMEEVLPAFAGAGQILTVERTGKDSVEVKIFSADGSVLAVFQWGLTMANSEAFGQNLLPLIAGAKGSKVAPYQQRVGIEALLPFYRGVSAYSSGQILSALQEFQRAREANHRFVAAYQWEQRCYDALGLPEFSKTLQRWLETGLEGRGVAAGGAITPRDGLTFLGVQTAATDDRSLARHWEKAAIRQLAGSNLLLPESLAALGHELDFLAAATPGSGSSWSTADGFTTRFTLRGWLHGEEIEWILANDLSGKVVARKRMRIDSTDARTGAELADTFNFLLREKTQEEEVDKPVAAQLPATDNLLRTLKTSQDQAEQFAAGLALLLQEPNHPLVIGLRFGSRTGSESLLGDYLDSAKRQVLLRLLPADDPQRPWVELQYIQQFLPAVAAGRHLTGEERDGLADLKAFFEHYAGHPAAALARFFWLTDMQAILTPQEVAEEARQTARMLSDAPSLPQADKLKAMAESMEWLGRAASGESGMVLDPKQVTPRPFRMGIDADGRIQIVHAESWRVEDFRKLDFLTPEEIALESRAALAIGGRSVRRKTMNPEWMKRFAESFSMASWAAWMCIHEFGHPDGMPHPYMGDYPAWRQYSRKLIQFAVDGLCHWLDRVRNAEQFSFVNAPIHWLVPAMGAPAHNLSAEEFAAFHRQLAEASARAAKRIGVPDRTPRPFGWYQLDWRDVTLEEIRRQGVDQLTGPPNFMRDIPEFLRVLREHAQEAFVAEIPSIRNWWEQSNWALDESMSNREIATQLLLPFFPDIIRTYGSGTLSDDERAMVMDAGILFMWGWRYAEAEQLFELVVKEPPGITSVDGIHQALQASALFHLARLKIQARNKPAAIRLLQEVLDRTANLEVSLMLRMHRNFRRELLNVIGQRENLRSLAVRLLEELRFDPDSAKLPERTFALRILTPQLENAEVTVFYRLPPVINADSSIMIMLPAFNDGGLELLEESSAWSTFADAHNLVLVVPQFFQNHTVWRADHPCAPYHFPQIWSGDAMLEAIAQIRSRHAVKAEKFHLYGRSAGAQCAARFARWKPKLVASLSLHAGASFPWQEQEIGLQPTSVYKGMPVLLTAGANDDHGASFSGRRYNAEIFHTVLDGVGANVDFHLLDSTFYRPSPSEQSLAEAFLHNHLKPTNP